MGTLASHTCETGNMLVMGDFNARVGTPDLVDNDNIPYVYSGIEDNTVNARGRSLVNMCSNNDMIITNHLKYNNKQLGGNLSFKRRGHWISELDLCLAKQGCLNQIVDVYIRQDILGSGHAPLCVTLGIPTATLTSINALTNRASMLGQTYNHTKEIKRLEKSRSYKTIDMQNFNRLMHDITPPYLPMVNQ